MPNHQVKIRFQSEIKGIFSHYLAESRGKGFEIKTAQLASKEQGVKIVEKRVVNIF